MARWSVTSLAIAICNEAGEWRAKLLAAVPPLPFGGVGLGEDLASGPMSSSEKGVLLVSASSSRASERGAGDGGGNAYR